MLKKSGAYVLTLLYIITAAGFTLNLNYCCSRLTGVKINSQVKSCSMYMAKTKCCQNKHLDVKVKDSHQGESNQANLRSFVFNLPKLSFIPDGRLAIQMALLKRHENDPPDKPDTGTDPVLKNCMLRI